MSLKNLSVIIKIPKFLKNKLKNKRINDVYNQFKKSLDLNEDFLVAVSGGPDSLALAFLAKVYSIEKKVKSKFYIVDHQLRPESTNEAKKVKKCLNKIFVNAQILTWKGRKTSKNIQSKAREARYQLLLKKTKKTKIYNILVGHHQDDLFENFFIRMTRGSGLKGLISFDKKVKIGEINLLRPLLGQKKSDLVFISKNVFGFYVEDPTNRNEKYQRTKIRGFIDQLKKNGLDNNKFLKTIENLKSSNKVIDFYVNENLVKNSFFSKKSGKLFLNKLFFQQPHEVVFRSLSESVRLIGKKYYSVRGKKLERLISNFENNYPFKATLGGCIIEKINQTVIISEEI